MILTMLCLYEIMSRNYKNYNSLDERNMVGYIILKAHLNLF
jgi:hypothetical protein